MEYKNENLGVSFSLPETVTVRQQLAYYSEAALAFGDDLFPRLWAGAKTLIQNWQCEDVPLDTDLDASSNPKAAPVMIWAGMRVRDFIDGLEKVEKKL
jgi:hypothetical protein